MQNADQLIEPTEIRLKDGEGRLEIDWDDGHKSAYPFSYVRELCQCAVCVDEWTHERRIIPGSVPRDIRVDEVSPVGRYALNFRWSDGHSTGIYSFELLRRICPCVECGGPKTSGRR